MGKRRALRAGQVMLGLLLLSTGRAAAQAARWSAALDPGFHMADTLSQLLSHIDRPVVTPDGQIFISEYSLGTIFHLARDGRLLGQLGRRGAGPGEFNVVLGIGLVHDSLWVTDPALHRITLFDLGTGHSRTVPWLKLSGAAPGPPTGCPATGWAAPQALMENGDVLVIFGGISDPSGNAPKCVDLLRVSRKGEILAWIDSLSRDHIAMEFSDDSSAFGLPQPFMDNPWAQPSVDGSHLVVIRPNRGNGAQAFALDFIQPVTGRRVHREVIQPRIRITSRIRDSLFDSMLVLGRMVRHGFTAKMLQREFYVPTYLLPTIAFHVMSDGSVWILPRTPTAPSQAEWDVWDSAGNGLARIVLPAGVQPFERRGELLWALIHDEDGVPRIERYRLKK